MDVFAVSLREVDPELRPFAITVIGQVAVVALTSAWRTWRGHDGEIPVVLAATRSLAAAANARTDWPTALADAFTAAMRSVDELTTRASGAPSPARGRS